MKAVVIKDEKLMEIDFRWKLIDQIAASVLILDQFGMIKYLNDDARNLLGINTADNTGDLDFYQYLTTDDQTIFDNALQDLSAGIVIENLSVILNLQNGIDIPITISGEIIDQPGENSRSIWTIHTEINNPIKAQGGASQKKLEDMQWLADQGRILLSLSDWSEILDQASQALQEKLGDCYVISLTKLDESNLQLEGIYGIENSLLMKVWKMIGGDFHNKVFPIDERFRETYGKRRLHKHPGGLAEFANSQVPENISKRLSQLVGLKDIYVIGLEGNQEILGCFYIFTLDINITMNDELVESFAFQVALALEKAKYARELEISEGQFQTIFEYAPDGYYISDQQGNFLNGNIAAEKITGYGREELIGKNFLKIGLISIKQIPFVVKQLAQGILGKSTGPDELVLTRKDGTLIDVEVSTYPVKMGDKSVVLGIARDITHRKKSEDNLQTAHDTLTRVLEGIDAHVYVADLETYEILYMNKRMIEDYGGNFEGEICYEIFRGMREICSDCSNRYLVDKSGNPGDVYVWEGQNKKTLKYYRNYDRAVRWTDQRLVRMQIAVDITDNIQEAKTLELVQERYRRLFETSHNALMTLSPPDWNFTSGNPALVEMFRLSDEKQFLEYKPWQLSPEYQINGEASKDKAKAMIQIAIEEGSNFFHWTHKKADGEEFPATVQLTRVDLEDEFFLQATVRDITEQVRTEKFLQQKMDDLALINTLNVLANQGQGLKQIFSHLAAQNKRLFNSINSTVYLLNEQESHLCFDILGMDQALREQIEKLIGVKIPDQLELPLKEKSVYADLYYSGKAQIFTDPVVIQGLMKDVMGSDFVPENINKAIDKFIPQILRLTGIQSILAVPLTIKNKTIGHIEMSSSDIYTEEDKERFVAFAEQLSGIVHRIQAVQDQETNIDDLELIHKTIVEGSRFDDVDKTCQHMADMIQEVNPESMVMVSLYDPEVNAIRVRALVGLGRLSDSIMNLFGIHPSEIQIDVTENVVDRDLESLYTSGKLELIPNGLYDLTRGAFSKQVCKSAERLLGINKLYIAGFGLGEKSIGGLIIAGKHGAPIKHQAAIETIVNHFAVIFERRLSQKEVTQRKEQLEALRDVELGIVSELDVESLLQSIAEKATAIVNAAACGFSIYNPKRKVLEYTAYTGFEEFPEDTDVYPGEGLSGRVWENRETMTVSNYAEWEGRLENWAPMTNNYMAGFPVIWGDEILGVLEIALDLSQSLSPGQISVLELFATQAAIAIKNARLFSEEKLRRTEADTLREVGVLINQMVDRPELLDMILSSLNKVVPYSSASIQLVSGSEIVVEAYNGQKTQNDIIGTSYKIRENEVAKQILVEGKNIILDNEADVSRLLEGPNLEGINSWLAVPLESKGNRIGILALDHNSPDQYSRRDAELVKDFAAQAVVAIENNHLFGEIRRRTNEIEAVYASALSLTKELQPEVLFEDLYQQIEPLFTPDAYILATFDQNAEMIKVAYATEVGTRQPQAEGMLISPDEKNSLLSWIVHKKSPLLIGNVETDTLPIQPQQYGQVIRSWLGVPLLVGDRVCGALVVQSYQAQAYTRDHQRLLQLLGNQVAIALENSRLFEDSRRRLSRLTSLHEIDQAISGSIDLKMTMDVLVGHLIHTLEVDAACVLAYDQSSLTLEYIDAKGFRTSSLQYTSLKIGNGLAGKAALERNLVYIPDLNAQDTSFQQSPQFGKEEFVTYIAQPLIAKGELVGVLEVFHREKLSPNPEWFKYLDSLSRTAAIAIDRLNLYNDLTKSNIELKLAYDATIEGWARAIELRDGDTEDHSRRVEALTLNLARTMGAYEDELLHMRRGALLHDIGKIAIPDGILLKAGKLTEEEWLIMKRHPTYAFDMLSKINYLKPALDIPLNHHERWDGSGYPQGLAGEDIPIQARIFAVVDVWDALQSDRPYREAWSEKKAIQYLQDQAGKEFDPNVVSKFLDLIGKS